MNYYQKMESTSNSTTDNTKSHISFYKDKHGIHFIKPLQNKDEKILSVENSTIIITSLNHTAVITNTIIE